MIERNTVTMPRIYYKAITSLPKEIQLEAFMALFEWMFDGKEYEGDKGIVSGLMILISELSYPFAD